MFDLYLKSVGRGANFLLNIPPDRRGLINEIDSASLIEFKKIREESFADNLVTGSKAELHTGAGIFQRTNFTDGRIETVEKLSNYKDDRLWIKFEQSKKINCIVLQEDIKSGQRVKAAKLVLVNGSQPVLEIDITTIGRKRILSFPVQDVSAIDLVIKDSKEAPLISEIGAYLIDEKLIEK